LLSLIQSFNEKSSLLHLSIVLVNRFPVILKTGKSEVKKAEDADARKKDYTYYFGDN
jgi:hypothetical protein